jgi:hypothetical protein
MALTNVLILLLATSFVSASWQCDNTSTINIGKFANSVTWTTTVCQGTAHGDPFKVGPLRFNIVDVDLSSPDVRLVPLMAAANQSYLQTLSDMTRYDPSIIAGVNGGYFWRLDSSSFRDSVCRGKTRSDAQNAPGTNCSGDFANYGVSDGLLKINGKILGCNCDKPGYSVPAVFVINGTSTKIEKMARGGTVADDVMNAIAAGPNLVTNGAVDIDKHDDNINIEVCAHLFPSLPSHLIPATLSFFPFPPFPYYQSLPFTLIKFFLMTAGTCGKYSSGPSHRSPHRLCARAAGYGRRTRRQHAAQPHIGHQCPPAGRLSHLRGATHDVSLIAQLSITDAMGMDQGGSTTMFVRGHGTDGIVSCSNTLSPSDAPRRVFDGLFVQLV